MVVVCGALSANWYETEKAIYVDAFSNSNIYLSYDIKKIMPVTTSKINVYLWYFDVDTFVHSFDAALSKTDCQLFYGTLYELCNVSTFSMLRGHHDDHVITMPVLGQSSGSQTWGAPPWGVEASEGGAKQQ